MNSLTKQIIKFILPLALIVLFICLWIDIYFFVIVIISPYAWLAIVTAIAILSFLSIKLCKTIGIILSVITLIWFVSIVLRFAKPIYCETKAYQGENVTLDFDQLPEPEKIRYIQLIDNYQPGAERVVSSHYLNLLECRAEFTWLKFFQSVFTEKW